MTTCGLNLADAEHLSKIVAVGVTGITVTTLLGYKALSGWLLSNLELGLFLERKSTGQNSVIVATLTLKKGSTDGLRLDHVLMRIFALHAIKAESLSGSERVDTLRVTSNWEPLPEAFALAPGDATSFAVLFVLPDPNSHYRVEALVRGRALFRAKSVEQWRISAISAG